MSTSGSYSKACCTLPPVERHYTQKGDYIDIGGVKTYHTGSNSTKVALITVYDVFGFAPQTLQGADLLARATGGKQPFQVFMPDLLDGSYATAEMFNGSEESNKAKAKYFEKNGPAHVPATIEKLGKFMEALKAKDEFKGIEKFGIIGFCWGAKIVSLVSGEGSTFTAGAHGHPSFTAKEDGEGIKIPICVLASMHEDKEVMKGFVANLKVPHVFETYDDMPHGWMAARGYENDRGKDEFHRAYTTFSDFFNEHLSK